MKTLYYALVDLSREYTDIDSRSYGSKGISNDFAGLVTGFAKHNGSDISSIRLHFYETKKAWEDDSRTWVAAVNVARHFVGKKVSYYNSFNGSCVAIKVEEARHPEGYIEISGKNQWGNHSTISIPESAYYSLITKGNASIEDEIDHCYVHKDFSIFE